MQSIEDVIRRFDAEGYIADEALATSVFLALKMRRPLFLEGAPGVGKTELALTLSRIFDTELIRLQCFEGIDLHQAVYEWNYPAQLLALQDPHRTATPDMYSEEYLLKRPLLDAIDARHQSPPVLLIDELDRADDEFESFLLELLAEYNVTIPEIGTIRATHTPIVVLTSNRTREIHDALKRRCIYHWIDYPSPELEVEIVRRRFPDFPEALARQVVAFVQRLRHEDLQKLPGIAETIDWAEALSHLDSETLDDKTVRTTAGTFLKSQDDIELLRGGLAAQILAAESPVGG